MHNLKLAKDTLEGIRASGLRSPHQAKGAQGAIKRDQLSFWRHSDYFDKQTHFVRSVVQRVYRLFSHKSSVGKIQPLLRGTIHAYPIEAVTKGFSRILVQSHISAISARRNCVFLGSHRTRRRS